MFKIYKVKLTFYEGLWSADMPYIVDCSDIDSRVWQWGLVVSLLLFWKQARADYFPPTPLFLYRSICCYICVFLRSISIFLCVVSVLHTFMM